MGMHADVIAAVSEEDRLRANVYRFLAQHLLRAPDQSALKKSVKIMGDDTELGEAFSAFAKLAANTNADQASEEYEALFIGLGRGELVPFASYYLTGFLNEKPLAKLRSRMRQLGIARTEGVAEPEDHVGSLMEIMAGLIMGEYGEPASVKDQFSFFDSYIAPWVRHFFSDLEGAKNSRLYQPVGTIGRLLMDIESTAFAME